jgi:hypothetical protein
VIGHALYRKLIHGGKAKNDKIARLLKGGNFPLAYAYPKGMRETRDKVPGGHISEYFPRQATIVDRLALVRSVDCRASTDHFPAPMQAGNPGTELIAVTQHGDRFGLRLATSKAL